MAQSEQTQPETELPLRTWLISFKTKRYSGERFFWRFVLTIIPIPWSQTYPLLVMSNCE